MSPCVRDANDLSTVGKGKLQEFVGQNGGKISKPLKLSNDN